VLLIAGLIVATFWVLRPFLLATLWATTIVVSTWPLMLRTQARLRGRRSLAIAVMVVGLLLAVVAPILLAVGTVSRRADLISHWVDALSHAAVPAPPSWVESLPLVGSSLADKWRDIAAGGPGQLQAYVKPYAQQAGTWLLRQIGTAAAVLVQLLLTLIISAILYAQGEMAAQRVLSFARRLAGARGESSVHLAAMAIRSVALGIILTALAQSFLTAIGLAIVGIPNAAALGVLAFVLCVAQVGPALVLVPAVIWLYWSGAAGWATALLVWSIPVLALDNIMRPILIRRGADLPLLLIFVGVIGGLLAFGVIGLFIGPVVLAVTYTLEAAWAQEDASRHKPAGPPSEGEKVRE